MRKVNDRPQRSGRDTKDGFIKLPRSILYGRGLKAGPRLLWAALKDYSWNDPETFVSETTLALNLGYSERTIRAWARSLEARSIISIRKRAGRSHLYELTSEESSEVAPTPEESSEVRDQTSEESSEGSEESSEGVGRKFRGTPEESSDDLELGYLEASYTELTNLHDDEASEIDDAMEPAPEEVEKVEETKPNPAPEDEGAPTVPAAFGAILEATRDGSLKKTQVLRMAAQITGTDGVNPYAVQFDDLKTLLPEHLDTLADRCRELSSSEVVDMVSRMRAGV